MIEDENNAKLNLYTEGPKEVEIRFNVLSFWR